MAWPTLSGKFGKAINWFLNLGFFKTAFLCFAVTCLYITVRYYYLRYQISQRQKKIFRSTSQVKVGLFIPTPSQMLDYKWFTGEDHQIKALPFDQLGRNECLHVIGRAHGHKFLSFGVNLTELDDVKTFRPICDNVIVEKDGIFSFLVSKSNLVTALARQKIGFNNNNPDHPRYFNRSEWAIEQSVFLPVSQPTREENARYMFYFDCIGGSIPEVYCKKYNFSHIRINSQLAWVASGRIPIESEAGNMVNYRSVMSKNLSENLTVALEGYSGYPLDRDILIRSVQEGQSYPASLSDVPYRYPEFVRNHRSDVTRFLTRPFRVDDTTEGLGINQDLIVFFVDHKVALPNHGNLMTRISLIDQRGEEKWSVSPSEETRLSEYVHRARVPGAFMVPGEQYQILESIFGSKGKDFSGVNPRIVYPMTTLRIKPMLDHLPLPVEVLEEEGPRKIASECPPERVGESWWDL